MDFDSIKNQVSSLSLYDLKAGVRKVQNAVMNYTEMESKVREATNNEPWGASSTLMQEIANGTFNYGTLNEIMPMIYKRFTEKAAEEWRQIYKALQLLEFLIKNGSERVIDDARSHLSLLKMLKQFHFIDQNGKDQGLNVRNRAKELTELLSDVDRIRAERKKARTTRNKYGGLEGGAGLGGSMSTLSAYGGGVGRDNDYGSYSGGVYGDGGGFGGNTSHFSDSQSRKDRFEEYDEYDEGAVASTPRRKGDSSSKPVGQKPAPPKRKEPEIDLFTFGDEDVTSTPTSNGKQAASSSAGNEFSAFQGAEAEDDDFDDFQSALPTGSSASQSGPVSAIPPPMSTAPASLNAHFTQPPPTSASQPSNVNSFFNAQNPSSSQPGTQANYSSISPSLQAQPAALQPQSSFGQPPRPAGYQATQPNYFGSVPVAVSSTQQSSNTTSATYKPSAAPGTKKSASGADPFAMLAGGSLAKKTGISQKGPTMADLSKQKAQAGIWGTPAPSSGGGGAGTPSVASKGNSGGLNDLLG